MGRDKFEKFDEGLGDGGIEVLRDAGVLDGKEGEGGWRVGVQAGGGWESVKVGGGWESGTDAPSLDLDAPSLDLKARDVLIGDGLGGMGGMGGARAGDEGWDGARAPLSPSPAGAQHGGQQGESSEIEFA